MTIHRGGCHCGAIRFEAEAEIEWAEVCNCSICTMKAYVHWYVPQQRFRRLDSDEALATYRFGSRAAAHHFCRVCGVAPFYIARSNPDDVDVNLRCVEGIDLAAVELRSFDGRDWERAANRAGPS